MMQPPVPAPRRPVASVSGERDLSSTLEQAVEFALERRWFEQFDISAPIASHAGGDLRAEARFLEIHELAHGEDIERSLHLLNMQNVLSTFRDGTHSVVYVVRGDGTRVNLYMGVRRFASEGALQTVDYVDVLRRVLGSNLPGVVLDSDPLTHTRAEREIVMPLADARYLAAVTGNPSLKQDASYYFTQSLDRIIDTLRGEKYLLVILADPIAEAAVHEAIRRCRLLSEEIHTLVRRSMSISDGETISVGETTSQGHALNVGTGGLLGMLFGVSLGRSWQSSTSEQRGKSQGLTVSHETLNKTAEVCAAMLEHYLMRLQNGRNLGFWNTGVYLAANEAHTFMRGQGILRGLFSGRDTHFEPLRVLDLSKADDLVRDALLHLRNPALASPDKEFHPLGPTFQQLSTPLTTDELSILVSLPRREVPGVKLTPVADFGLNPPESDGISLGNLLYRGERLPNQLKVPTRKLTQHAFVTGITGAGKTNTCLVLLRDAFRRGIPFLVIEPAKTEYRALLGDAELGERLWLFTLGDEGSGSSPFRLNPFDFEPGFPLLTHIDLLKAVFNAAFPMYASMPFILEEAILEIYIERGWDIATSTNRFLEGRERELARSLYLPRIEDLYNKIDEVVASKRYAQQLTMDISAALKARLKSLLNGGKGRMLNVPRTIPFGELLNRPVILELRRVGDDDEKAFVMALLLVRLYEHREMAGPARDLVHITLVEEAHRLLRNVPVVGSMETANTRGKAVEMFTDILAEVREYGEGMVIVDQVPNKLAPDVIKNTNLKVLHRVVAQDDRDVVGNAMNLTAFQKEHVVRLRPGQAVIHMEGLDEAVLVQIHDLKDGLRTAVEHSVESMIGERSAAVRNEFPEVFHRFVGCDVTDAYCVHLPDRVLAEGTVAVAIRRLLRAVQFSPVDQLPGIWHETRKQVVRVLVANVPRAVAGQGLGCYLAQLIERAVHDNYVYYRQAGAGYEGVVVAQEAWAHVLQLLERRAPLGLLTASVEAARRAYLSTLGVAPARPMPGCKQCRRVCAFGETVQNASRPTTMALVEAIEGLAKDPEKAGRIPPLLETLVSHAARTAGVSLDPEVAPHFAYCCLANVTTTENVLKRVSAAIVIKEHLRESRE